MIRVARKNRLEISRIVRIGAYLTDGTDRVFLPTEELPEGKAVGDELEVFVYTDTHDRLTATLREPYIRLGGFAALEVIDEAPHGLYLDWGLDKDLLLPEREQSAPHRVGDTVVVCLTVDRRSNRPVAHSRLGRYFDYEPRLHSGEEVQVLVYGFHERGAQVVVNGRYRGLVYANETYERLSVGDERPAWVKEVREDGRVDLSLQRMGSRGNVDAQERILAALHEADGFLPLHDKSEPEAIRRMLQMSKKAFKRGLGGLYKAKKVRLDDDGVRLIES